MALIRRGTFTDAISSPEGLQTSWISSDKQTCGLVKLFCAGRAPLNQPSREFTDRMKSRQVRA